MRYLKNIAFTFIAVVVVPLLFFVLVEFGLQVFGVGTGYDYFHAIDIDGEPHYQENPRFAQQFYPASLNIGPLYNTFSQARDTDLLRVYVLGGSAAMGYPHKNHGVDRLLATQLRAALPSRQIEVINTAMTSVNSHVIYEVARTLPAQSADFAVILVGNNEVVGPYGPGTFNQNFLSSLSLIRGLQALKRTRIWQALSGLAARLQPTDARQELEWQGMQMFTEHGITHDDPRLQSVYRHYEQNLRDTIETLRAKGIHVILSSVPVNLRHSAPFLSVHGAGLSAKQIEEWERLSEQASAAQRRESWREAIDHLRTAIDISPEHADTHFRLATAYEHGGEHEQAATHYRRALDLDALRFRADTRINAVVAEVAASVARDSFDFVDSAAAFEQASGPFQPGWNLLLEHVHYDFTGNHVLAAGLARAIVGSLKAADGFRPLPMAEVASRTGFPNHETIELMKELLDMVQKPPFPGQSNYTELESFIDGKITQLQREVGTPAQVLQRRKDVIESGEADWRVHFEMAMLSQHLRDRKAAYRHFSKVIELYPHNRESYIKLAEIMGKEGKPADAIPLLERSLYYTRGDEVMTAETTGQLGTAYLKNGEYDKATAALLQIPARYPDQIGASLRAYATLIKYARQRGETGDAERYVEDVQDYARALIRAGRDKEYPLLYRRMAQIMTMAGDEAEARKWLSRGA